MRPGPFPTEAASPDLVSWPLGRSEQRASGRSGCSSCLSAVFVFIAGDLEACISVQVYFFCERGLIWTATCNAPAPMICPKGPALPRGFLRVVVLCL